MFYLVGSRYFGTHRKDSDWDYIAQDDAETRRILEARGYKRLESIHVRYHWANIDICLVKSIEAELYARMRAYEFRHLPKAERHQKIKEFARAYELGRDTQSV